jgi:histidinol phosphatase-like PHP family hydrolase
MALVDLHLHSNKSDGEYAPAEVVRRAADAGLRVVALTDHDTAAGLAEALFAAREVQGLRFRETALPRALSTAQGVQASFGKRGGQEDISPSFTFIPGIEITTEHAHEQHILGYLINYEDAGLKAFIARLMSMRRERADNILSFLKKKRCAAELRADTAPDNKQLYRPPADCGGNGRRGLREQRNGSVQAASLRKRIP